VSPIISRLDQSLTEHEANGETVRAISNEYNVTFWILAYLLYDESLFLAVKQETEAAWRQPPPSVASPSSGGEDQDEQLDVKYLSANSPRLEAIFNETLRLRNGAGAIREVTKTCVSGGKVLQAGNSLMIPFRQLHTNEKVWGPTVNNFDPSRFLDKKSLARHPSFRPFGGGATMCAGKTLAKEEVFGFIAILLRRFDVRLAARAPLDETASRPSRDGSPNIGRIPPFPLMNDTVPSLGINGPIDGMDVIVDITTRCPKKG
jgi:cholesterol 7alpha-monooxygenase